MKSVTVEHIKELMKIDKPMRELFEGHLRYFMLAGRRDIVKMILEPVIDDPIYQVNKLMVSVLYAETIKDLPENYNKLSVLK
jgi:rRNA pseudouridine-1189 N-methylase Emg1 (Nep1/Mra1 family)